MTAATAPTNPPGRLWYILALAVFLLGMAAMAIFLVTRLTSFDTGLTRFVVPGEHRFTLETGGYTIFHEAQSVIDGKIYQSSGLGGLGVTVTDSEGRPVGLSESTSGRYSFGNRTGFAAFDFTIDDAGVYVVAASYADGAPGPETVLAVGAGFLTSVLWTILGSLALAFLGAIIGAAIIVIVLVRRRRAGLRF